MGKKHYWGTLNYTRKELIEQVNNLFNTESNGIWLIDNLYIFGPFMQKSDKNTYDGLDVFVQLKTTDGLDENSMISSCRNQSSHEAYEYKSTISRFMKGVMYKIHIGLSDDNLAKLGKSCRYTNDITLKEVLNQPNICIVKDGKLLIRPPHHKKSEYKYAVYFKKTGITELDNIRFENLKAGLIAHEIDIKDCKLFIEESTSDNLYSLLDDLAKSDITLYTYNYDSLALHSVKDFYDLSYINMHCELNHVILYTQDFDINTDTVDKLSTGIDPMYSLGASLELYSISNLIQSYTKDKNKNEINFGKVINL